LEANLIRDFEHQLETITLRPFDDGRFMVYRDGALLYDKERTGRFPEYDSDIRPKLRS
jgi:predicted Rdx family selenoprotein